MRKRAGKAFAALFFRCLISAVLTLALVIGTGVYLYYNGLIIPNDASGYNVRGVDVSSYQGHINWDLLGKDIDFAYIKATEGSDMIDPQFVHNSLLAETTHLRIGYYMFFNFDVSGEYQADFFIDTVGKRESILPPAIDVELYKGYKNRPPERSYVDLQLKAAVERLREYYGVSPVIYCTKRSYDLYIAEDYYDCDIWIRDVFCEPQLSDGREWTFWQYTDKQQLEGYDGEERFIDMNVFCGGKMRFEVYGKKNT